MRWGVTIFKMPPSTAATVNQFLNPKVSDVERGREKERKAKWAICYSSLEWIISPLSLYLFISFALSYFFFLSFFSFFFLLFPLSNSFWATSTRIKCRRGGLSLQNVIPVKQGPTHACISFLPPAALSASYMSVWFLRFVLPLTSKVRELRPEKSLLS